MARMIDADYITEGRVSNDPVVIAAKCAPTIDAIPVEWLEKRRENLILAAMVNSTMYGDNSIELCHAVNVVLDMWQKEQEART